MSLWNEPEETTYRKAYRLGLLSCVAAPLLLQMAPEVLLQLGPRMAPELAQELGYTFTAISFLLCIYVRNRSKKALETFPRIEASQRPALLRQTMVTGSLLLSLMALLGLAYAWISGPHAERHARTFLILPLPAFFLLIPRRSAWNKPPGS